MYSANMSFILMQTVKELKKRLLKKLGPNVKRNKMKAKINYKAKCLEVNKKFRVSKCSGVVFYHIIVGSRNCHTNYSGMMDTPSQAWKSCYEGLKEKREIKDSE